MNVSVYDFIFPVYKLQTLYKILEYLHFLEHSFLLLLLLFQIVKYFKTLVRIFLSLTDLIYNDNLVIKSYYF